MADSIPAVRRERARAPVQVRLFGDRIFNTATFVLALAILALLLGLAVALIVDSFPAIRAFGLHFFVTTEWDPVNDQYGALPFIYGTFVSSLIALVIAVPLSLGVALCLSEMAPDWLSHRLGFLVDLLAAIPSVVYGLWAVFVMGPWIRDYVEPPLAHYFGWLPFFQGPKVAVGMLSAGVILAIMIVPYISSVCTDVFRVVPHTQREAALALGATKWEMVKTAVIPYGMTGVIGAIILGLGPRARRDDRGRDGNRQFGGDFRVAVQAGRHAGERDRQRVRRGHLDLYVAALIELGLVLLILGIVLNVVARGLVLGVQRRRYQETGK